MKTSKKVLFTSLMAVAVGLGAISLSSNQNRLIKEASATASNPTSGKFVRVTEASQITEGGSYIFVSDNGYALSDIWGNPGYVYGQQDGVAFSNQGFVTLKNSPASVFGVEKEGDNFAFFTAISATGQIMNKAYLAYNDDPYKDHFDAIGYFYGDRTGVSIVKNNNSLWSFRYDENNGNYIANVGQGGDLGFTFGYAPRFCRNADHRVEIYKETIAEDFSISIVDDKYPTITTYSKGDEIKLSGLEIDFHSTYHNGSYAYDDHRHLFSCEKYASSNTLAVTFMNLFIFNVPITVTQAEYYASKVTSSLADYRGQYMLVSEYGPAFNGLDKNTLVRTVPCENGKLKVHQHSCEEEVKFVIEKAADKFYLKNHSNKYLSFQGGINYTDEKTFAVVLENDQGGIRIKGGDQQGKYLNFYNDFDKQLYFCLGEKTADNQEPVFLYKYDYTNEVVTALDGFASGFISATMVCDPQGMTNNITDEIWSNQAGAFADLDPFAQAELINKSYSKGNTDGDVIAQAVERYDYIISKYTTSTFSDFIGRVTYGTLKSQNPDFVISNVYKNSVDMVNVIIICVATFLGGVLVYSFIRLRKDSTK